MLRYEQNPYSIGKENSDQIRGSEI
jgi:hypothetical protein